MNDSSEMVNPPRIESLLWEENMEALRRTSDFLASCDVLDLKFSNGQIWEVYVASTMLQRSRGLSEVSFLNLDGMLFYYEASSYVPFTMTNMRMDIDIAWYDEKGTLIKIGTFTAGHPEPILSSKPFKYVLEAPAGTIPKVNLEVRNG